MKIGVQSAFSGATPPELIAEFGGIIEERGFHSLWVPEHVVFFGDYASRYPYSDDARIPGEELEALGVPFDRRGAPPVTTDGTDWRMPCPRRCARWGRPAKASRCPRYRSRCRERAKCG